jgi:hypothetical protein
MSVRLYDYYILPAQVKILFAYYNTNEYDVIDSFIFWCDVYKDGYMSKKEFICVKIKKPNDETIYCNNMDFEQFIDKCLFANNSIINKKRKFH